MEEHCSFFCRGGGIKTKLGYQCPANFLCFSKTGRILYGNHTNTEEALSPVGLERPARFPEPKLPSSEKELEREFDFNSLYPRNLVGLSGATGHECCSSTVDQVACLPENHKCMHVSSLCMLFLH